MAIRLYGTMSAEEGYNMMDRAFEKLGVLLREEHPQLLSCLLLLLSILDKADLVELIDQLLFHTHNLSNSESGSRSSHLDKLRLAEVLEEEFLSTATATTVCPKRNIWHLSFCIFS